MTWVLIITGLSGAVMLSFGCNLIVPVSSGIGSLCDLAGVTSMVAFCGLMEGQ
jgi:hypothetical protein